MQVILLERVEKLGQMGDVVKVKDGFARNFLLPRKKALRATKDNVKKFEGQKAQLEARNLAARKEAEAVATKLDKQTFIILRQAGETGMLYGSVSTRDIAEAITAGGVSVNRDQVILDKAIKMLGLVDVKVQLHPEVRVSVTLNVARTVEEAERQARGENVLQTEAEQARAEAEAMFEEAAAQRAAAEAEAEAAEEKAEGKRKKSAKADDEADDGEPKKKGKKKDA
ncbi:MAG: 50S ribosomal protein L9 [Alphaproteobacteria bacterium]|nr:50S ribosomal protein L9 [Alphaproteobacteria bacterium]